MFRVFGDAVGSEQFGSSVECGVVGQNCTALGGRDRFDRVKTQFGRVGEGADLATFVRRAQGMRGVGDDFETVLLRYLCDFIVIGGMPGVVDGNNQLRALGDGGLEPIWVEVAGVLPNIDELDRSPQIKGRVRGRGEGQR